MKPAHSSVHASAHSIAELPSLRQQLRRARRQLSNHERMHAEQQINQILCQSLIKPSALNIAAYLPNDGEVNVQPAIQRAWSLGHRVWLPAVNSHDNTLRFVAYRPDSELITEKRFGLLQPTNEASIAANQLDRAWMPLVGFAESGARLGMGGGFYDRCFARKRCFPKLKPNLIGIAFELQRCNQLPQQPWDVTLDCIITEDH